MSNSQLIQKLLNKKASPTFGGNSFNTSSKLNSSSSSAIGTSNFNNMNNSFTNSNSELFSHTTPLQQSNTNINQPIDTNQSNQNSTPYLANINFDGNYSYQVERNQPSNTDGNNQQNNTDQDFSFMSVLDYNPDNWGDRILLGLRLMMNPDKVFNKAINNLTNDQGTLNQQGIQLASQFLPEQASQLMQNENVMNLVRSGTLSNLTQNDEVMQFLGSANFSNMLENGTFGNILELVQNKELMNMINNNPEILEAVNDPWLIKLLKIKYKNT